MKEKSEGRERLIKIYVFSRERACAYAERYACKNTRKEKKQCTNFTRRIEINSGRDYEIGGFIEAHGNIWGKFRGFTGRNSSYLTSAHVPVYHFSSSRFALGNKLSKIHTRLFQYTDKLFTYVFYIITRRRIENVTFETCYYSIEIIITRELRSIEIIPIYKNVFQNFFSNFVENFIKLKL